MASGTVNKTAIKTRAKIRETFLNLLNDKPFDDITVTELSRKAGINRVTFYSHYTDLHELLQEIQHEAAQHFLKSCYLDKKPGMDYLFSAMLNEQVMKTYLVDSWESGLGQKEINDFFLNDAYPRWKAAYGINTDEFYRIMAFITGATREYLKYWSMAEDKSKLSEAVQDFESMMECTLMILDRKSRRS